MRIVSGDGCFTVTGLVTLKTQSNPNQLTVVSTGDSTVTTDTAALPLRRPLVSVIVTAYNCKAYIVRTLQSVLQQSYRNLKCLTVEDGGTDGTFKVVEGFLAESSDARFRLLRNDRNRGQLASQIRGFRESSGQFVVFLDADDLLSPDALEVHLAIHMEGWPVAAMAA